VNEYLRARNGDITIGRVVGENDDGITLFIPKDIHGTFHLSENDTFLSLLFVKTDGHKGMMPWCPWANGPVLSDD
jgi:hypothetical protein